MGTRGDMLKFALVLIAILTPTARSACLFCRSDLACRDTKLDLTFVVDGSGSICEDDTPGSCGNWITILEFVVRILGYLNIGPDQDRVGFIQFSNKAQVEFFLGEHNDLASLTSAIQGIRHLQGNTNTSAGLQLLRQQGGRAGVTQTAIVITDGISTYSTARTIPEAELAKAAGIKVYAIGITNAIDEREIRLISMDPQLIDVSYFILPDFVDLKTMTIVEAIHNSVCVNYEINNRLKNCPGTYSQTGCYVLNTRPLSKFNAQSECSRIAADNTPSVTGELVAVHSQAMQDEMTRMIRALSKKGDISFTQDLWIGASKDSRSFGFTDYAFWTWSNSTGDIPIADQGCFLARSGTLNDLTDSTFFSDVSSDNCTTHCATKGYKVTGVQNGDRCLCGNVYGQFGGSSQCTFECPRRLDGSAGKCGGVSDNSIYLVGGAYGEWEREQPKNDDAQSASQCGVISGIWGNWKMASEVCYKKLFYICQLNVGVNVCRQAIGGTSSYAVIGNKCIFVSRDSSDTGKKTWFGAQTQCKALGGELLSLDSSAEHELLKNVMQNGMGLQPGEDQLYWAGLLAKRWTWQSGERVFYQQWGPDQPSNSRAENCMVMTYSTQTGSFTWSAKECTGALPSICRIDLSKVVTTTTTPTTTTDLTSPVTSPDLTSQITTTDLEATDGPTISPWQTTNITNLSTAQVATDTTTKTNQTGQQNPDDPNLGASTAAGGLGTVEIIVIAILVGLVVVGAIIGCIACAYHKKGQAKQSMVVYPDKADYLQANVLTPYNQYYEKQDEYYHSSGLVMDPAHLTKTESYGGEDHVYMKFNGGTTNGSVMTTTNTTKQNKRSEMYTDIPYHTTNGSMKSTTQTFNVKSQDFGTRRMASRDTSRMTISADGRLINMNDE